MGKGKGVFGNFNGKVGNVVGYALKNSNNKQTQGLRQWQPNVSNPRSNGQALQRMLIGPALRFYKWLIDPIDNQPLMNHSFEGVEYGNKSRQYFMKLAMSKKNGPYILKSVDYAVPAAYQIADGSLPAVNVTGLAGASGYLNTDIMTSATNPTTAPANWGELSQRLIASSYGFQDGDQITVIGVDEFSGRFVPTVMRIVLDSASTAAVTESETAGYLYNGIAIAGVNAANAAVSFSIGDSPSFVAGAIVVSRRSADAWLRSPSTMWLTAALITKYYSESAMLDAMASYQDAEATVTSDKYLNNARSHGETEAQATASEIVRIAYQQAEGLSGDNARLNGEFYIIGVTATGRLVNILRDNKQYVVWRNSSIIDNITPAMLGTSQFPSVAVEDVRISY